jgi:hypothetical protein
MLQYFILFDSPWWCFKSWNVGGEILVVFVHSVRLSMESLLTSRFNRVSKERCYALLNGCSTVKN